LVVSENRTVAINTTGTPAMIRPIYTT